MIQYYEVLKVSRGYSRITSDDGIYNVYLFNHSIPEIDMTAISDFELENLEFDIPVVIDGQKFESSNFSEGSTIKTFKLSSIRKFQKLRHPEQL